MENKFELTTKTSVASHPDFTAVNKVNLLRAFNKIAFSGNMDDINYISDEIYCEAVLLIKHHANDGIHYVQFRLEYMFEHGLGLVKSPTMGGQWYQKAAEQRYPEGMDCAAIPKPPR